MSDSSESLMRSEGASLNLLVQGNGESRRRRVTPSSLLYLQGFKAMRSKAAIRREQKLARRVMDADTCKRAAYSLFLQLRNLPDYRNASRVAVYFPMKGEMDTSAICADLWQRRKSCFLPRMIEKPAIGLAFARYSASMPMLANRFGIPEPDTPPSAWLPARFLDLILLPLVAFDRNGNRLGMGGGYYDSALAFRRIQRHVRRPRVFGLAYAQQEAGTIPADPWDIRLDGIITDKEVILAKSGDDLHAEN